MIPALHEHADNDDNENADNELWGRRCPGAGKWVEHDSESRQAYAARTGQRHGQLSALGWHGTVGMTLPSMPANGLGGAGSPVGPDGKPLLPGGSGAGSPGGKRSKAGRREHLKRLPADIRAQVQVLQVRAECERIRIKGRMQGLSGPQ